MGGSQWRAERETQGDSGVSKPDDILIVGQGLAGTCLAWRLWDRGVKFRIAEKGGRRGSSIVAAGMMSPVTGRAMNPTWQVDRYLPEAMRFYQTIEKIVGENFLHEVPVLRLFSSEKERGKFEDRKGKLEQWTDEVLDRVGGGVHGEFGGVVWKGAGWLKTQRFLSASKGYFREHGLYEGREVSAEEFMVRKGTTILCKGAAGLGKGAFGYLPERRAKGEILTVKVPGLAEDRILSRNGWMIPRGGGLFRAGSGYEWNDLTPEPTTAGREKVEEIVRSLTSLDYEVLDHMAGIRPIVRSSQPVIGWHRENENLGIFNGLGSKGVMYAPGVARALTEHLCSGSALSDELDVAGLDVEDEGAA